MMLYFNIFWHSFVDRDNDDSGVTRYELTQQEESVNGSVLGVVCISTNILSCFVDHRGSNISNYLSWQDLPRT